jgi:zinc transporter ZupT
MLATGARRNFAVMVPFSAGILLGVMAFGLLPEVGEEVGWRIALALFAAGYLFLYAVNEHVYPVCPTCSHTHDHAACATLLHGFAAPLVAAAALHSFLDGWSLAAAPQRVGDALAVAITIHKVPEGLALGALLSVAVKSRSSAFTWLLLAQLPTLAGAAIALTMAWELGVHWTHFPLAFAAGCLMFLGGHAVHNDWKRRGVKQAVMPAVAGAAGAAAIQHYAALLKLSFG